MDLKQITNNSDIKKFNHAGLLNISSQLRTNLYEKMAKTGGFLASNLSVVDLTLALHYVFDIETDSLIFDGNKHAEINRILNTCYNIDRSLVYASTMSIALGMAEANALNKLDQSVVAILGANSINNGINFEALGHISKSKQKLIIVYNDASPEYKNVGNVDRSINKLRTSKSYNHIKGDVNKLLSKNIIGKKVLGSLHGVKNVIKKNVLETSVFREFGIEYLGPVDGHDLKQLISAFEYAKNINNSVIVHVASKLGHGIARVEHNPSLHYNALTPYDPTSGKSLSNFPSNHLSNAKIVANTLLKLSKENQDIVTISTDNLNINYLDDYALNFSLRTFDISNSEVHASSFAAGLALSGKKPFLALSSKQVQTIFKQVNNDIAKNKIPVVFGINDVGLNSDYDIDSQGIYDIGLLTSMPNMIIAQAKDQAELQDLVYSAFEYNSPIALRYSDSSHLFIEKDNYSLIKLGSWTKEIYNINMQAILISYGNDIDKFKQRITINNLNIGLINARFIRPIDQDLLNEIANLNIPIYVYENELLSSGLSSQIINYFNDNNLQVHIDRFGIDDIVIEPDSIIKIRKELNLDSNTILSRISQKIEGE